MQQQDFIRARIDAFQDRFGMRHVYLALHAAFPLSLSPDLLYLLRDNFQRDIHGRLLDIPWEAVSDLLLSELCQETGQEAYRMAPETRNYLLARLRNMPRFGEARIQELHEFIAQYYGPMQFSAQPEVRALAEAQLWAAQLQAQPGEAVQVLSRTLYRAQDQSDLALQLRLHYLMEAFPGLEGETGQLQHYARAVAMDNLGLVADAREAAASLQVSGGAVSIGGVTFGVKEDWMVVEGAEQQQVEEPELDIATLLRNTLQQLRWMGLYDGSLEEDWKGIEKHIKMRALVLPGDAHPILMESPGEWVAYANGRISAFREQMPQVKVHLENWERLREYVEPVLEFWRVEQSNGVEAQAIQGQMAYHNILDDQAVETKDVVVIGVDQEWLRSNRYDWIVPAVREAGKPILPVILSPCEWQNSALNEYRKVPDEAGSMEEVREREDRLREVQFALGRMLREATEKLMARQAELAFEQSEEGKAKVREIQQQLRWLGEYDGPSDGEWASIAGFYPDLDGQPFETRVEVAGTRNREARGEAEELLVSVDNLGEYEAVFESVLDWWRVKRANEGLLPAKLERYKYLLIHFENVIYPSDLLLIGVSRGLMAQVGFEDALRAARDSNSPIVSFLIEHVELSESAKAILKPYNGFVKDGRNESTVAFTQFLLGRALRDALRLKRSQNKPEPPGENQSEAPPSLQEVIEPELIPDAIENLIDSMMFVQGGSFMMGDDKGEEDARPAHKVTVSDFFIGKFEVTQTHWKAVMGINPSTFKGVGHPVDSVSWRDCQEFLERLSKITGRRFRLPTEAEWEYAARGGRLSKGFIYAGSDNLDAVGWYAENSRNSSQQVGLKQANELGLHDMSGNVWEWCQDGYDERYYAQSEGMLNPPGAGETTMRVLRGGMSGVNAAACRVTHRSVDLMDNSKLIAGLRLVMDSEHPGLHPEIQKLLRDMVHVEGGAFMMGDDNSPGEADKPARPVELDSFQICKYQVTQAQWQAVMGSNPSHFQEVEGALDCPVELVSWHDCKDFIGKLNALTGERFRLPTEAEWEYAARGGRNNSSAIKRNNEGIFSRISKSLRGDKSSPAGFKYAGSDDLDKVGWYLANSKLRTHPVGLLDPNALGLYDMSGNVCEWCEDWYSREYYKTRPNPDRNPKGPESGTFVVVRGGSFLHIPDPCLASFRIGYRPDDGEINVGFRVARD